MDFLSSNSLTMMEKSMGFLWTKQAAILDNIANAETPNYKAKVVTFEESFRDKLDAAMSSQTPRKSAAKVLEEQELYVTEQSAEMVRNSYQLQYVMSAISSDLSTLRTAIRGQ